MKSRFYSLDGNRYEYIVHIADGNDGEGQTLDLGGDAPFVVNWENSGHIYHPVRYSGATINVSNVCWGVVFKPLLTDWYASEPKQIPCSLSRVTEDGNKVVWTGYVTPTMYDQDYTTDKNIIQIDAVDGLSVLRYIKYPHITRTVSQKHNNTVWEFLEVLLNCIRQCGCYDAVYVSRSVRVWDDKPSSITGWDITQDDDVLKTVYLSEDTFYDHDHDEYLTCDVVLESICQYLSLTAVAVGNAVYLINYDAINKDASVNMSQFFKYTGFNSGYTSVTRTLVNVAHEYSINTTNSQGGGTVSLDKVYSKVTVKDEVKRYDKLFTDYDEPSTREIRDLTLGFVVDDNLIVTEYDNPNASDGKFHALMQIYEQKNYSCYQWTDVVYPDPIEGNMVVVEPDASNSLITLGKRGACLVRQMTVPKKYGLARDIQNLNFTDYIMLRTNWDMYMSDASYAKMKYVEIDLDKHAHAVLAAGGEGYLVISGSMLFEDITAHRFIPTQYTAGSAISAKEDIYLVCRLQMWDHYFNGSSWQRDPCQFELPFNGDDDIKLVNQWFEVRNNITWISFKDQLNATGWAIPLPFTQQPAEGVNGQVNAEAASYNVNAKFTIFGPKQVRTTGTASDVNTVWIKDLRFEVYTRTTANERKYQKINNLNYVDALDDTDFKLTTYDHREQAYSHVSVLAKYSASSSSERRFVQEIRDQALGINREPEQMRCEKLARQYAVPRIVLEETLTGFLYPYSRVYINLLKKWCIVDTLEVDYLYGTSRARLVEKA